MNPIFTIILITVIWLLTDLLLCESPGACKRRQNAINKIVSVIDRFTRSSKNDSVS